MIPDRRVSTNGLDPLNRDKVDPGLFAVMGLLEINVSLSQ